MSRYLPVDTFNTGTIDAETSEAFARSFGHNFLNIVKIKVTPSGSTVGYSVKVYKDAALTQELLATKDNVVGFFYAPTTRSGGEALEGFVAPYEDLDELGNLNIVITNHDLVARNYDVEITCEVPAIIGGPIEASTIVADSIGPSLAQQHTLPALTSSVIAVLAGAQTFTGKTISGADNTLSNIANASLTNSSLTVTAGTGLTGGGSVALGASTTIDLEVPTDSNVYTPTLTAVANVAASTPYQAQWMRVGNTVTVSGKVDIDATAVSTLTQLRMSLPVASNFGAEEDLGGVATSLGNAGAGVSNLSPAIYADATNNEALIEFETNSTSHANQSFRFIFAYQVI